MDARPETGARQAAGAACPACGARLAPARVMTALWQGGDLVLIRDVPALVCDGCRERYFEDATVMRLDLMRADGFAAGAPAGHLRVPVYAFPTEAEEPA